MIPFEDIEKNYLGIRNISEEMFLILLFRMTSLKAIIYTIAPQGGPVQHNSICGSLGRNS